MTDETDKENGSRLSIPDNVEPIGGKKTAVGYPAAWANDFGEDYYRHQKLTETLMQHDHLPLIIPMEPDIYNPYPELSIPPKEHTGEQIEIILNEMAPEDSKNE